MNGNIEIITPELWAVNSAYIKSGWIKELTPLPALEHSTNEYASLTNDGIMILKKESGLYPTLKQIVPCVMKHTDKELQSSNRIMCSKAELDEYERLYKSVLEWEVKRRQVRAEYMKIHPIYVWKCKIKKVLRKVGDPHGYNQNGD